MRKFAFCWLMLAVVALAQNARQDLSAQESKLLVLEHLWNEAQVSRDASALQGMISDRFINTEWDGEVSDHDKFLADIRDPRFKPTALTIQDVKVSSYRDTAIITGVYHAKGTYQGKSYDHIGRFTDTWIYDSGKWQCVASHTSLLKK
jgi:ketosteroid isomerase-like protein